MPRVSVIVPACNASRFLPAALDSVLRQTFGDWECVVVDDASADGGATLDVAAAWMARDDRFHRVQRETNGGIGAARNSGAAATSGDLLCFLDSDDVLADDAIAALVAAMDAEDHYECVHGCHWLIDEWGFPCDGKRRRVGNRQIQGWRNGVYPTTFEMLVYFAGVMPNPGAAIVRRSAFEAIGGFDEAFRHGYEDHHFWLQLAARHRLLYVPAAVLAYRLDETSAARNAGYVAQGKALFLERLQAMCEARLGQIDALYGDQAAEARYMLSLGTRAHSMAHYETPAPIP